MKKLDNLYYGLDIQKDYISVVQYSADTNSVTLVALQPIPGGTNADQRRISKEIGVLKSKFKFEDKYVNCSLTSDYAVIKRIPVDRDSKEVDETLVWELGQNIIGSSDEYVYDYQPCGKGPGESDEYLVVAFRKERIDALSGLLKSHKLIPRFVDLDLFALGNIFEVSYPDMIGNPAFLIHAESDSARLVLVHEGKLVDYEVLTYELEPDPGMFGQSILSAVERLNSGLLFSSGENIKAVPFFGSGMLFSKEAFFRGTEAVLPGLSILHPFRKIECRIGVDEGRLSGYLPQLSIAAGLAIRGDT